MANTDTAHDSDHPKRITDPEDWPGLVWRLAQERPILLMIALLLLGYGWLRIYYNVDPLKEIIALATQQTSTATQQTPPLNCTPDTAVKDLVGDWEYTAADERTGAEWGGTISISSSDEKKGEKIKVTGSRTWETKEGQRVIIKQPVQWTAFGVAYLADNQQVEWRYLTHESQNSTREGVAFVNAQGKTLAGTFSDIHETTPRYGPQTLQRHSL